MSVFRRLELWSNLQYASGVRLAVVPGIVSLMETRSIVGEEHLDVLMAYNATFSTLLAEMKVLRVVYADDTFDEWRITDIAEGRDNGEAMVSIKAAWPSMDLATYGIITPAYADGTWRPDFEGLGISPDAHLTSYILPAVPSWVIGGRVMPSYPVDVVYAWSTPQQAIDLLASSTFGEFQLRRGSANLITNSFLGVDTLGWVGNAATYVRDTTLGVYGGYTSMKYSITNIASDGAVIFGSGSDTRYIVTAGDSMTYECWVYATGGSIGKTMRLVPHYYITGNTGGGLPDASSNGPTVTLAAGWNRLTYVHTVPASMTRGLLGVYTDVAEGTFDVWMSGAVVCKTTPDKYLIDLVQTVGWDAPVVSFRAGRNLAGVKRTRSTASMTNFVYPRGTSVDGIAATMARARWKVIAVDSTTVTLADPVGGDGPILFDNQLNNFYLRTVSGSLKQITASVAATQKVSIATASTFFTVNDLVEVREDSSGSDHIYLMAPASVTTYGRKVSVLDRADIPGTVNLCPNPAQRAWAGSTSTPADSWAKVGSCTVTKTTSTLKTRVGGQSTRVETAADGVGIEVNNGAVVPTTANPYFSGYVSIQITSGKVRLEMVVGDGTDTWVIPSGTENKAWSNVTTVWVDLGISGIDLKALGTHGGCTTARLRVLQDGAGTADFYVDCAQITQSAGQLPFIEGAGGTQLWQEANRLLERESVPTVRLDVDILDLNRLNPTTWPSDLLVLGQTVNVTETDLNIISATRALEYTRDLLVEADTRCVLSNRPEDMTDALVRPQRARRLVRNADLTPLPVVTPFFQRVNGTPYQVQVTLQATPPGCTIYRWFGLSTDTVPIAGVIGGSNFAVYGGPFTVPLDASTTANARVACYAVIGNRQSPVQVFDLPLSPAPSAPITLSEPVGGTLRIDWTPNAWVRRVRLYRRQHATNWPTLDGTTTGTLDNTYFIGEYSVSADGGGFDANGAPITGGTRVENTGWTAGQIARVIIVPMDELDNVPASASNRNTASRTMSGTSVSPALTAFTLTGVNTGSSCSALDTYDFSWTPNAGVVDATHDLLIYADTDGSGPVLIKTITSPLTTTTTTNVPGVQWNQGSGPSHRVDFTYELVAAGPTVVDSGPGTAQFYTARNSCA